MKKINLSLLLVLSVFTVTFSQVPNAFNYQAVVRSSSGEVLANQSVSFRISILQDSESGTTVYSETQTLSTNSFGLVNFEIGNGNDKTGAFSPVGWGASPHFIKIEFDPAGGTAFTHLSTSEMVSVPYAFHAQTATDVDDADADPSNELQILTLTGTLLELSNGGGSVTLPTSGSGGGDNWGAQTVKTDATLTGNGTSTNPLKVVPDGDGDATNELQTITKTGNTIVLSNGGGSVTDAVDDADADTTNELQILTLTGTLLELSNGGGSVTLPTSDNVGGDNWGAQTVETDATLTGNGTSTDPLKVVADGDGDATNELQTITKTGNTIVLSNGGGSVTDAVDDADADTTNELQILTLTGTLLELSNGGGSVTLPALDSVGGDNWGAQTVETDATLTGNGTSTDPLKVVADGDGDATNELQAISLSGNELTLSDGGSVTLPATSVWTKTGTDISYGDGKVIMGDFLNYPHNFIFNKDDSDLAVMLRSGQESTWMDIYRGSVSKSANIIFGTGDTRKYRVGLERNSEHFVIRTQDGSGGIEFEPDGDVMMSKDLNVIGNLSSAGIEVGSIKLIDGTQGAGKVLTSDANGLASWAEPDFSPWLTNNTGIYYNTDHVGVGVEPDNVVMLSVQAPSSIIPLGVYSYGDDPAIYANNYSTGSAAWFDGAVKITDGTQGTGKVLTSDANGLASWAEPIGDNLGNHSATKALDMNNNDVNYVSQLHFNDNVRFYEDGNDSYLNFKYGDTYSGGIKIYDGNETLQGALFSDGNSTNPSFGLVDAGGHWAVQVKKDVFTSFFVNNFEVMRIQSDGKVGIGTTSPTERLEVNGNIKVDGNISLSSSGKIGVGTSTPSAPLEIKSNEINALIIGSATANYNQRPGIQFKNNTSQFIAGDDGSDEIFGFYSKWGSTRTYDAKLRVYGNTTSSWGTYIQFTHDGTNGFISTDTGNLDLTPNGNVGIKTNAPTATLDVNGTVRFRGITSGSQTTAIVIDSNGNLHSNSSDRRLKENIHPLNNGLDKVLKLRGVTFTWKANPEYGTRIGFIAQEFEKVVPELAFTNPVDGYKGVNYAEVTAVLVEAVKEQQKMIEAMKTENNQLKAANDQIVSRLEKLESLLSVSAQK